MQESSSMLCTVLLGGRFGVLHAFVYNPLPIALYMSLMTSLALQWNCFLLKPLKEQRGRSCLVLQLRAKNSPNKLISDTGQLCEKTFTPDVLKCFLPRSVPCHFLRLPISMAEYLSPANLKYIPRNSVQGLLSSILRQTGRRKHSHPLRT